MAISFAATLSVRVSKHIINLYSENLSQSLAFGINRFTQWLQITELGVNAILDQQ